MGVESIEHELWGYVPSVDSFADLFNFAPIMTTLFGVRAWRGQADARWQLDSSLARKMRKRGPQPIDDIEALTHDDRLLEAARRSGLDDGLPDLELLARLQHHGGATRLLDWTRSAMVAAWFACRELPDHDAALMGFVAEDAEPLSTGDLRNLDLTHAVGRAMEAPLWWQPRGLSPRIPAQQAMLVLASLTENPWGTFTPKMADSETAKHGGIRVVILTAKFKADAEHYWEPIFGFNEQTMFPDFDGFAHAHRIERPLIRARP